MPKQLDLDGQILAPLLEGLRAFAAYDPGGTLAADLQRAATSPGHRLAEVLNEPFDFGGDLGRLSRRGVLLEAMRRGGRVREADTLGADLEDLRTRALAWDEEARPVVTWNVATFAHQAFEARQAGRRTLESSPAELLGERLYEELMTLGDAADDCRKRVEWIAAGRTATPKGRPGRPPKYPGLSEIAAKLRGRGATNAEIARAYSKKTGVEINGEAVRQKFKRDRAK